MADRGSDGLTPPTSIKGTTDRSDFASSLVVCVDSATRRFWNPLTTAMKVNAPTAMNTAHQITYRVAAFKCLHTFRINQAIRAIAAPSHRPFRTEAVM